MDPIAFVIATDMQRRSLDGAGSGPRRPARAPQPTRSKRSRTAPRFASVRALLRRERTGARRPATVPPPR